MTWKNTETTYGSVSKFFHWLIFFLVAVMLCAGPFMGDISDKALRGQVYTIHKTTGICILALMVLRVLWALTNKKPNMPPGSSALEKFAERAAHVLFYVLLLAMPLSGWIMSTAANKAPYFFGIVRLPLPGIAFNKPLAHTFSFIHTSIAIALAVLIVLHVTAALLHHYVKKDNVLRRMTPFTKK